MEIKTIVVAKHGNQFRADSPDLSGSPSCGIGRSKYEAVGSFLYLYAKQMGLRIVDMEDGASVYDFCNQDLEYIKKYQEALEKLRKENITITLESANRPE
jgi:hypothetical protein